MILLVVWCRLFGDFGFVALGLCVCVEFLHVGILRYCAFMADAFLVPLFFSQSIQLIAYQYLIYFKNTYLTQSVYLHRSNKVFEDIGSGLVVA